MEQQAQTYSYQGDSLSSVKMEGNSTPSSSRQVARASGSGSFKTPAVSLARQVVLDEDEYTASLSHIIKRDFFPTLPRLAATNAYLSALESQDSQALASSIRALSSLGSEEAGSTTPKVERERRRREAELAEYNGTPYISRTPFGGADLETPLPAYRQREQTERSEQEAKRRKIDTTRSLDNFQAVYTSEDNASFLEILTEDNARRKEKFSWAFDAETKATENRLRLEQDRRKLLIEHGGYVPTDDGLLRLTLGDEATRVAQKRKQLVQGPNGKMLMIETTAAAEIPSVEAGPSGPPDQALIKVDKGKGRATDEEDEEDQVMALILGSDEREDDDPDSSSKSLIRTAPSLNAPDVSDQQLVIPNALPRASTSTQKSPQNTLTELPLPAESHLARALNEAGLPETALLNKDGQLVPARDITSGSGEGLGRGDLEKAKREMIEKQVMSGESDTRERTVPTWAYKTRNAFMFGPDADVDPLKRPPRPATSVAELRQNPPEISYGNTRMMDDDDLEPSRTSGRSSARASSPTRSRVAAAIGGTPYRPNSGMPTFNDYALVPAVPSPSPEQLGPEAVSQLMTWGSLMSTPRALGTSEDPLETAAHGFKINEPKRRDDIGRRLAKDASRAMRERAKGYGSAPRGLAILTAERPMSDMGPPASRGSIFDNAGGTTPRRNADTLTPAGRTLLQRSMGTPISNSRRSGSNAFGGGAARGRAEAMERTGGWTNLGSSKRKETSTRSWTPSPAVQRK